MNAQQRKSGRDWDESEVTSKIRARDFRRKGGKGKSQRWREVQRNHCMSCNETGDELKLLRVKHMRQESNTVK